MKPTAEILEDLQWLDETNVGATEAAERTGFPSAEALEKWLERHGAYPLWQRFKRRDPEGMHSAETRAAHRLSGGATDSITALLAQADKSPKARTRNRVARIRSLVDELREALGTEVAEQREQAKARAEIERLERQLIDARARLRGVSAAAPKRTGPAPKDVRAWAAANGVECNSHGRVPSAVVEQFEAAQKRGAA